MEKFICSIHGSTAVSGCRHCEATEKAKRNMSNNIPSEFIIVNGDVCRLTDGGKYYTPSDHFELMRGKLNDISRRRGVCPSPWENNAKKRKCGWFYG